jgi:hypothetical protein
VSIRVNPRLRAAMRRGPGHVVVQVRSQERAQATEGLRHARRDLASLGSHEPLGPDEIPADRRGRVFVGQVVPGPEGPLVWLDGSKIPLKALLTAPAVIERNLRDAGVTNAEITTAREETPEDLLPTDSLSPCLTLRLFPDPPVRGIGKYSPIPAGWLDQAWSWLARQMSEDAVVTVRTMVPFQLPASAARAFLDDALTSRVGAVIVLSGEPGVGMAALQGYFGWGQLALSAAGSALRDDQLVAASVGLKEVARHLAPELAHAYLRVEPALGHQLATFPYSFDDDALGSVHEVVHLIDELLFDVSPWQILGPGHIRRLGAVPHGAVALAGDRYELTVGELNDWLPGTPTRQAMRASGGALLAPLLVRGRAANEISFARYKPRGGSA